MIFARKMPKFDMIIARKKYFPPSFGILGAGSPFSPSSTFMKQTTETYRHTDTTENNITLGEISNLRS